MKALYESSVKPAGEGTAPLKVVMSTRPGTAQPYVTHIFNCEDNGTFHGHYFMAEEDAIADYEKRCKSLGVSAYPH